ncbi:hypothetical protein [Kitasatospora brasiliensis]|uniref:hypothetical protein n=1 Tax=Kitasatospora brasiliensis TaxID=3058040 RepID=UPI00292D7B23|nr:hypothetical protein [Kitasatospora sp. K002]
MPVDARSISTFSIPARFNGPPTTANGGYACGVFAGLGAELYGPGAAVTLLVPPPLDTVLEFHGGPRRSQIRRGDELIATVGPAKGDPEILEPVRADEARAAAAAFRGEPDPAFRDCFVCGGNRRAGDGLLLTPGPVTRLPGTVACLWTPDSSVCEQGRARAAVVWGVLDCPGGWTADPAQEPMVLSWMTARIAEPPVAGRPYVVVGRETRRSGRTASKATALYTEDGRLVAHAAAVWTAVNEAITSVAESVHRQGHDDSTVAWTRTAGAGN